MTILTATGSAGMGSMLVTLVLMLAVFYFMLIRPENKKKKAAEELRNSLKIGDDVTTIGGILGTVCAVKENSVVIETGADRVRIEMTKWAIGTKGSQTSPEPAPAKKEKKDEKK